ncbi:MAG TPA: hypothetical protein VFY32_04055 [Solirubrobacteraceae bacterium]|nr:hypothetical protein [Solirubrobacteraceae bacterium]
MTLQTRGSDIVGGDGEAIRLKGTNIGGWLNMENFITGYAANESMMRAAMLAVLGQDKYELFFETLLTSFYGEADAAFLAESGLTCVRIPVNYRNPFAGTRLSEDDVAVADLLERTGAWARGEGAEPYSLADGLQDHLISVAIGESAETGRDVTTEREAWAR